MRRLRRKRGKLHRTEIDIFGKNIIDSSLIRGAFAIRNFIREKKQMIKKRKHSHMMGRIEDKVKKDFNRTSKEID